MLLVDLMRSAPIQVPAMWNAIKEQYRLGSKVSQVRMLAVLGFPARWTGYARHIP